MTARSPERRRRETLGARGGSSLRTTRLDQELVARGLARSRSHAQSLILAGQVTVEDRPATKASGLVDPSTSIEATTDGYVSRAAHKLIGALDDLEVAVPARALDAGASTGGFTQVLLERGCREVVAVDVGTGQLATGLRADPRVEVRERTNLRDLRLSDLDGRPVDLVVADLSFISLTLVIDVLSALTTATGRLLLMVKPQFEVGRERLGPGGVVRSAELHRSAVQTVIDCAGRNGWAARAARPSRLAGAGGNREFFVLFDRGAPGRQPEVDALMIL
jgi:23S rRNA (cytidine1920-2'-O)/16S rRNA (cytidine1409-2'-O)-methyltransferase